MLLTLEGLDGSGKTTAWRALRDRYPEAVFTREPTDSWYGDAVARSIDDDDADPMAELFLYTADHADHLSRVIRPALDAGSLVISDRYSDSRIAYQAATLDDSHVDDPFSYVRSLHDPFSSIPRRPPSEAAGRTSSNASTTSVPSARGTNVCWRTIPTDSSASTPPDHWTRCSTT